MREEKVSVVVTCYNFAGFIGGSIRSVLRQTYKNIEIIVADDASTDGSQEKIMELAERHPAIVPVLSRENRGISHNTNEGLNRCSGKFVAIFSGDDLVHPDKVARQIDFLNQNSDCGVCTHDMEVFCSESGEALYRMGDKFRMPGKSGIEIVFSTNWFFGKEIKNLPSSMLGRADFLLAHRFDGRLKYWGEWLHMIDCLATSGLQWGHLPEVLGRYRVHDKQVHTSEGAKRASFEEMLLVLSVASARYPEWERLIRAKREFTLFQHLLFDWLEVDKRKSFEGTFRREAGLFKWLYMKLCRAYLRQPRLFQATRPLRQFAKYILAHI